MKRPSGFDRPQRQDSALWERKAAQTPKENETESHANPVPDSESETLIISPAETDSDEARLFRRPKKRDEALLLAVERAHHQQREASVWDADHLDPTEKESVAGDDSERGGVAAASAKLREQFTALWNGGKERLRGPENVRSAKQELKTVRRKLKKRRLLSNLRIVAGRRKQLLRAAIVGGAVFLVAGTVAVGVYTPLMSVQEFEITGNSAIESSVLEEALRPLQGKPIALVSSEDVAAALEPFGLVQRYTYETVPPHTLVVRIQERQAVLALESAGNFTYVDAAGVTLFENADPPTVPVAKEQAAVPGSKGFFAAAEVLRDIAPELRAEIAEVSATTSQDVVFRMRDGLTLRWGSAEDTALKSVIYARMRGALADRSISVIDVSSTESPVFG
ncbi:cell division protein FtsQ/DivIB [Canibacter zhoujuaniae]|uniref:cell division protein FtsQ/DivIB n=1 Tax=Canibacter zhoujuaniae TaxID=2708343 RepID=UPI001423B5EA|nr:FtsQ-type POTRA domain-containing protein [Canibacter zhoujuaniae]